MIERERDPVVARALQELPVPDHAPGFWARLDDRLDAADRMLLVGDDPGDPLRPDASGGDAERRLDTSELPSVTLLRPDPGPSREARLRFLAAALVLAVVAIGTGIVLRGDGSGDDPGTAADDPAAATAYADQPQAGTFGLEAPEAPNAPRSEPIESMTATTASRVLRAGASPEDAATRWIEALNAGRLEEARYLVGSRTSEYVRDATDGMDAWLGAQLGHYAAWDLSRILKTITYDVPDVGAVVAVSGFRIAGGGSVVSAIEAIPVVEAPDGWYVEPLALTPERGGSIRVESPAVLEGTVFRGQDTVVLRATSEDPDATLWFSVDGQPPQTDADGVWAPPTPLSEATGHPFVVIATGDRLFAAVAGWFEVAG